MQTFIKYNSSKFDDTIFTEYKGLLQLKKLLQSSTHLKTPHIIKCNSQRLELEYIQNLPPTSHQVQTLGRELAKLHKQKFEQYGLSYNNYIGLNPQKNSVTQNWGEFFLSYRLLSQVNMIEDKSLQHEFTSLLNKHSNKLISFLNETTKHPSLVHGDLWSGNVLFNGSNIYLIDPAIYFGDREVDIAMSELFGGFRQEFYKAYEKEYSLSKHYKDKKEIYNLYHLLNHYNLFGSMYLQECQKGFAFIEAL
ncbi:MAG: fructosamine kinase family protein [Campylobacterales bacterium]|nr:fructosamine kinase family protein [Campylobacterales bacterium]